MSKLTKLTKAVPAKKPVASKKVVNSRYFTTPTYGGDWDDEDGSHGWDELLAEFYIQSRDCSGAGVVDPINVAKLLNMVGLRAVVVSGVNNEDYEIRHCFTGSDVCGNILLSAITSKFIARNPNVINQLLNIELTYNGNTEDSVENTRSSHLFPSVVDIASHSATRGALGAIKTWTDAGIRIDASELSAAAQKAIELFMKEKGGYADSGAAAKDYVLLTTITDADGEETVTGTLDGTVFDATSQILIGVPLENVDGIGGDACGVITLAQIMGGSETYSAVYEGPDGSSAYWGRLNVACFFFEYSDVLDWIVASARGFSDVTLLSVLEDFNTLSDEYLYGVLALGERVEVLSAKTIAVLVHILNDEEEVEDLVTSIIAHKSSGLTTLLSVTGLPTTPRVPAATEGVRKFFGVLSQVVSKSTHTGRELSFDDLDGSEYAALFYFTRAPAAGNIITISSKVTGNTYTTSNFTESGNKLSDANIASLLEALDLKDSDALDINLGSLTASATDAIAQGKLVALFNAFGAEAVFGHLVVTSATNNWNNGKTVLALYLQIVGSNSTTTADSMMRYINDVMAVIKTVRSVKASIQASCHTAVITTNEALLRGLLRLLDHGAESSDVYELLGTSESDRRSNVRTAAGTVSTVANGAVDWRKVNELIQLAGIQIFSTNNNGVMNTGSTATMLQNWALAFADTDAETYAQLHEAGFEAWELLTYTRTTNVYKVVNGRAVKGADETTMAFNIDWVCEAYGKTPEQLAKEAYDNYGITLAIEEEEQ